MAITGKWHGCHFKIFVYTKYARLKSATHAVQVLSLPIKFMGGVSSSDVHLTMPIQADDDSRLCIFTVHKKKFLYCFKQGNLIQGEGSHSLKTALETVGKKA